MVYFLFLVTGIIIGVGLLFVWVGFAVLLFMFASWWVLFFFERQLVIGLLQVKISPLTRQDPKEKGLRHVFAAYFTNPVIWKGLLYLLAKFPLGVINFTVCVTAIAIAGALLTAPLIYRFVPLQIWFS